MARGSWIWRVALAQVYHAFLQPRLRGPQWARGAQSGGLFLLAAWPLVPRVDRIHPLIRRGDMLRLSAPVACGQKRSAASRLWPRAGIIDPAKNGVMAWIGDSWQVSSSYIHERGV
jgi:hypothetical protein